MTDKCCKTCKHWDRDQAKDAAGRIRGNWVAPCLYPIPILPESSAFYGSKVIANLRPMAAGYGLKCEAWEKL